MLIANWRILATNKQTLYATTKFVSPAPEGVEIVPVVYITIESLRAMEGREAEFANLIVEHSVAMCYYNKLGKIRELQLNCDWTSIQTLSTAIFVNMYRVFEKEPAAKMEIGKNCLDIEENCIGWQKPSSKNILLEDIYKLGNLHYTTQIFTGNISQSQG